MMPITDTIVLQEREIKQRFVRAIGPGGQNLNRDATAVELRVDLRRTSLPSDLRARLSELAGRHVTSDDVLVVVSRMHHSQAQNREAARARLQSLLKRAAAPPKIRTATKANAAARENRLAAKKRHGAVKRARSGRDDD